MVSVSSETRARPNRLVALPRYIVILVFICLIAILDGAEKFPQKTTGRLPGQVQRFGSGRFHINGYAKRVSVSEDSKLIFVQCLNSIMVLDRVTGNPVDDIRLHTGRGQIGKFASSRDGRLVAVSLIDRKTTTEEPFQIVVIDTVSRRRKILRAGRFAGDVTFLKFSPDRKLLVARSLNGTFLFWNISTGERLPINLPIRGGAFACFSPDGQTLAVGAERSITFFKWPSQEMLPPLPLDDGCDIAEMDYSPDGRSLLIGRRQEDGVLVVNLAESKVSGEIPARKKQPPLNSPKSPVTHFAFSSDGRFVAVPLISSNTVELWDISKQRKVAAFSCWKPETVAISADDQWLVVGGSGSKVHVFDFQTHRIVNAEPDGHDDWITRMAFTEDGRQLASASDDGSVIVWNITKGTEQDRLFHGAGNRITGMGLAPDGSRIVTSSQLDSTLRIWKDTSDRYVVSEKRQAKVWQHRTEFEFFPDGQRFVAWNGSMAVSEFDATDGNVLQLVQTPANDDAPLRRGDEQMVPRGHFYENRKRIIVVSGNGLLHEYDTTTGKRLRIVDAIRWEGPIAFSPDGKMVVSTHVSTSTETDSPQSHVELNVTIREYPSLNVIREFQIPDTRDGRVAFSPDSERLAFTSNRQLTTIDVLKISTGRVQSRIAEAPQSILLKFSPDGKRLATAHSNSTVSVWDLTKLTVDE